jgi:D-cysteine desulfhydrase
VTNPTNDTTTANDPVTSLETLTDESLPSVPIGTFPTAVERFDGLAERLAVGDLYVKRDDRSGELYGGNKVRKLAYLLGDARRRGIEDVWTIGSLGSNHVLATSLYAREHSFVPHAIQYPEPVDEHVRDTLRVLSTTRPHLELHDSSDAAFAVGDRRERRFHALDDPDFYYIPPGGATPVGELGFVNAALELRDQIDRGELPEPDAIVVPVGSGGTLAGLACGCHLAGLDSDVVGVRTAMRSFGNAERIAELASETSAVLAEYGVDDPPSVTPDDVTILHDYVGDGYGEPSAAGRDATELAGEFGLDLDATFTAKTVAALTDDSTDHFRDQTVLYWHTYNSVDLSGRTERAAVEATLPETYRQFFPKLSSG